MITVSLATLKNREKSLKQVVKSILPQTDILNIYLHGYTEIPNFLKNEKINAVLEKDYGDRKDNDKFYFMNKVESGYHILIDDDLIYPKDFIKELIKGCKRYKNEVVVGFHGRIINELPIATYYYDSVSYSCLKEVESDIAVDTLGTGCLCYHTKLGIQIDYVVAEPFMSDIHFSLYCKKHTIPMIVLKHKAEWIKHYPINLKDTIFEREVHKDYIQTNYINSYPNYYNHYEKLYVDNLPIITVAVANTRLITDPDMVKECYDSIKNQSYPNIEIMIIENQNKEYTIGKCWNDAVRNAKGEWILFVGDDDKISPDYVNSLAISIIRAESKVVHISSYLTMFRSTSKGYEYENMNLIPTGAWRKSYLLEFPCPENKIKFVDTEMMGDVPRNNYKSHYVSYHYGYYYRSHSKQTSGMKSMRMDYGNNKNTNTISTKAR